MNNTTYYSEKVKRIRQIVEAKYSGNYWLFRQGGRREDMDDPLWWRLDVWDDDVNSYCLFDLRDDLSMIDIRLKLKAMDVARDAYLETISPNAEREKKYEKTQSST